MADITITFFPPAVPDLDLPDSIPGDPSPPPPVVITGGFPGLPGPTTPQPLMWQKTDW